MINKVRAKMSDAGLILFLLFLMSNNNFVGLSKKINDISNSNKKEVVSFKNSGLRTDVYIDEIPYIDNDFRIEIKGEITECSNC